MTDKNLTWREVPDITGIPGWSRHVGFTVTKEPGDAPAVTIWAARLETGNQTFQLNRQSLPNVVELEAIVSEEIEGEDHQAALELSQPDRGYDAFGSTMHALGALR